MTFLAVLPSIYAPYTEACLASMAGPLREQTMVVDNTERNRGVAASWNIGVDMVLARRLDWLVIISAAVRFGDPGGLDFLRHLEQYPTAVAVEGGWGLGWHLIAFSHRTLERVGRFDECLFPGWMEDLDMGHRIRLAKLHPPNWPKVDVDAWVQCFAHAERFAGVRADAHALAAYMDRKWGSNREYEHPFNDPTKDLRWWPTPPDERALMHGGWA